jgi:hypothetical protein
MPEAVPIVLDFAGLEQFITLCYLNLFEFLSPAINEHGLVCYETLTLVFVLKAFRQEC